MQPAGPLIESELLDAVATAVLVLDIKGYILFSNRAFHQLLGYTAEALRGQPMTGFLMETSQALFKSLFEAPQPAAFPLEHLVAWRSAENNSRYFFALYQLQESRVVCTLRPLEEQLDVYRQMFENSRSVKLLINPVDGALVDVNAAAAKYYGYSRAALRQMTLRHIFTGADDDLRDLSGRAVSSAQYFFEGQHRLADGTLRDVTMTAAPLVLREQTLLYMIVTDVTEAREIEKILRDGESRYRQVVETMQQGVSIQDENGHVVYANEVFCEIAGYSLAEMVGQSVMMLLADESKAVVQEQIQKRAEGESSRYSATFRHKSGDLRYVLIAATPITGTNGDYRGSFSIVVDVTASKQLEIALTRSNAELDAFAHTVAHDLKSPLSVLIGFADMLLSEYRNLPPQEMHEYLEVVGDTADRMIGIVDELLLLSQTRHRDVETTPLTMPHLIEGALQRLRYTIQKHNAEIIVPAPESFPPAQGYAPWLEAVWANYISNAIKYGGMPPRVELSGKLLPDGRPCFSVHDNGNGIPPDKQARLFIQFERLEEARAEGNGIGLSIVKRIMDKLGGEVHVKSAVGQGSTFSFILPPADTAVSS